MSSKDFAVCGVANLVHTDEVASNESTPCLGVSGANEPGTHSSAGEHRLHTAGVVGSIPTASTIPLILAPFGFSPPSIGSRSGDYQRWLYFIQRDDLVKVGIAWDVTHTETAGVSHPHKKQNAPGRNRGRFVSGGVRSKDTTSAPSSARPGLTPADPLCWARTNCMHRRVDRPTLASCSALPSAPLAHELSHRQGWKARAPHPPKKAGLLDMRSLGSTPFCTLCKTGS